MSSEIQTQIDRLFQAFDRDDTPGYAVSVRYHGKSIYEKGFGMANLEYGLKITPDTIFHVASVSKQFTAFCVLMLAEEGKISLDDPIRKYLPQLPIFSQEITVRHLLHHTSGLREQWDMFTLAGSTMEDLATSENIMRLACKQRALNFVPGEKYTYCNTGYTILAELVKAVSGKTLREFEDENIFKPLGMANSYLRDDHGELVKNRAASYGIDPKKGKYRHSVLTFDLVGSTSLNTTASDLMKWIGNFYTGRVGSKAVVAKQFEKFRLNNGETIDYCCGIKSYSYRGATVREHTGSNAGFRAVVLSLPEIELDVVVLSNYMYSFPIVKGYEIVDIVAGDILKPKEKPQCYSAVSPYDKFSEGLFASTIFEKADVRKENGDLIFRQENIDWLYVHTEGNEYRCRETGLILYLKPDGSITRYTAVNSSVFCPVTRLAITESDQNGLSGIYYSPELRTVYELSFKDNELLLEHIRLGTFRFIKTGKDSYLGMNRDGLNLVLSKRNGKPCFFFNKERIQNLQFVRVDLDSAVNS